jgi:hypothetical protein
MNILVAVSVASGTPNATVDVTTVTGVSSYNAAGTDIARDTTTISAPTVVVTKSVDQPTALPGATLTYTITVTNTGSARRTRKRPDRPDPANTTYVPSSITLDGVAQGDGNADGDSSEYIAALRVASPWRSQHGRGRTGARWTFSDDQLIVRDSSRRAGRHD